MMSSTFLNLTFQSLLVDAGGGKRGSIKGVELGDLSVYTAGADLGGYDGGAGRRDGAAGVGSGDFSRGQISR